jgi:hypothetical protein
MERKQRDADQEERQLAGPAPVPPRLRRDWGGDGPLEGGGHRSASYS